MANIKRANTSGITKTGTAIPDVPDAPTIGTATAGAAGSGQATVTYTAAATGGAVTTFTATSTPGSITGTGASPITVSGLTIGTAYTFTVSGANSTGTSPASAASNSITPTEIAQAGYFMGGNANALRSTTEKILFSSDTRSVISSRLSAEVQQSGGFANSGTAGYTSMGNSTTANKLIFSDETISNLGGKLGNARDYVAGAANSGTAGYWAGGDGRSTIDKINFSNDTSQVVNYLLESALSATGAANSGTAAYFAGGTPGGGAYKSYIQKLTFSNDSRASISAVLSVIGYALAGAANSGTAAYFSGGSYYAGGASNIYTSNIDKLTFSNETRSLLSSKLSVALDNHGGLAKSGTAAYFAGGYSQSVGGRIATITKLLFSNDSSSTLGTTLSEVKTAMASAANSGTL
jgi:hypothetical protein